MTLRRKTLLAIGMTLLVVGAALYLTSRVVLLGSFSELEEQDTFRSTQRVLDTLQQRLTSLNSKCGDWANWDDSYAFARNPDPAFVRTNVTDTSFEQLQVNLIVFYDGSGRVVFGGAFDLERRTRGPVPERLARRLKPRDPLLRHPNPQRGSTGIIALPRGPMLVASRPILDSDGRGPSRGTLVFGRYLDAREVGRLAVETGVLLAVQRLDRPVRSADFRATVPGLLRRPPMAVRPLDHESVAGYALVRDIAGVPALVIRASMPRSVFHQGEVSLNYLMMRLLAVGAIFSLVITVILERTVLARVAGLNANVTEVGSSGGRSRRVEVDGRDELAGLAASINDMLGALQDSDEERRRAEKELERHRDHLQELVAERTSELHGAMVELEAKRTELAEMAKKTIESQEKERQYLAAEIHDDLLQGLVAVSYFVQGLQLDGLDEKVRERQQRLVEVLAGSVDRARRLLTLIRPVEEPQTGLPQAIDKWIDTCFVDCDTQVATSYPEKLFRMSVTEQTNILRVVQEALSNARKHSQASHVEVEVRSGGGRRLKLVIRDDGVGFDIDALPERVFENCGLSNMRARTQLFGGDLVVTSEPGRGTTVTATFLVEEDGQQGGSGPAGSAGPGESEGGAVPGIPEG